MNNTDKDTNEVIEGEIITDTKVRKRGQFAPGTKIHRPLKFKSVEEVEKKIEEYFESCFEDKWFDEIARDENGNKQLDNNGKYLYIPIKKKVQIKPMTITGLASYLGTNRTTLINYENRESFFDTIRKAKETIEANYEERALVQQNNPMFSIFALKNNFDWKDKSEVENTDTNINKVEIEIIKPKQYEIESQRQQDKIQSDGNNVEELEQQEENSD